MNEFESQVAQAQLVNLMGCVSALELTTGLILKHVQGGQLVAAQLTRQLEDLRAGIADAERRLAGRVPSDTAPQIAQAFRGCLEQILSTKNA